MTIDDEIAALKVRLALAESDRDVWRVSGRQEKYLQAHSMVEALELRLDKLVQSARLVNYPELDRSRAFVDPAPEDPGA